MCNNHACNGHACNSRACNSHAWWYTRRVCFTPREIVVHANTLREYLKISRGATRLHACKNEVIIERYRSYASIIFSYIHITCLMVKSEVRTVKSSDTLSSSLKSDEEETSLDKMLSVSGYTLLFRHNIKGELTWKIHLCILLLNYVYMIMQCTKQHFL